MSNNQQPYKNINKGKGVDPDGRVVKTSQKLEIASGRIVQDDVYHIDPQTGQHDHLWYNPFTGQQGFHQENFPTKNNQPKKK
jgi:hypothetical protein